jgi:arylsulfatase
LIFLQQKTMGTLAVWQDPWVPLRLPLMFNLRRDPYERAFFTSNNYYDWMIDKAYLMVPAQAYVARFLGTFKEYPPRMKPGSFTIDKVMEKMTSPGER